MARPIKRTSPLEFTSTELGLACGLTKGNFQLLRRHGVAPEPTAAAEGMSGSAIYDIEGVKHAALIGAMIKGGVSLISSARIGAELMDYFLMVYSGFRSNFEPYLFKPLNDRRGRFPWDKYPGDNQLGEDFNNDFWVHHRLVTRTDIYKPNQALVSDVVLVIADRKYVFLDSLGSQLKQLSPSGRSVDHTPEFLLEGWDRDSEVAVRRIADLLPNCDFSNDPQSRALYTQIEDEFVAGRENAVALLRINLSLACRNALDSIHEHRLKVGEPAILYGDMNGPPSG